MTWCACVLRSCVQGGGSSEEELLNKTEQAWDYRGGYVAGVGCGVEVIDRVSDNMTVCGPAWVRHIVELCREVTGSYPVGVVWRGRFSVVRIIVCRAYKGAAGETENNGCSMRGVCLRRESHQ